MHILDTELVSPLSWTHFVFRVSCFPPKTKRYCASKMLLIRLSFLLSAGQAIGLPQVFPDNGFGRNQNGTALTQVPTPLRAVLRGFRTPLPFDEDIFDPTYVVSNLS